MAVLEDLIVHVFDDVSSLSYYLGHSDLFLQCLPVCNSLFVFFVNCKDLLFFQQVLFIYISVIYQVMNSMSMDLFKLTY